MRIREIRDEKELAEVLNKCPSPQDCRGEEFLNSSPLWLTTWWKHFGKDKELFSLAVEDDGKIIGFAPLYLASFQRKKVVRFKRAYFLGEGLSDYGCILGGNEKATVAALLDHLSRSRNWHELRLQNIPTCGGHFETLCQTARDVGFEVNPHTRKPTHCFYIDTTGDFHAYLKATSRDVKKDVPRRLSMIGDAGGFELKLTGELPLGELLEAMADIHTKRQGELGRESFFQHEDERGFIREICELYHQQGWLDYAVMRLDGKIAAYMLGFRYGGVRYSWNVGFDPKYNELSLGKVLAYLWIEDAFRRKEIVEFNFMRGDSEFKRKFTDKFRWNHHFITRHPRSLYVRGIGIAEKVLKIRE